MGYRQNQVLSAAIFLNFSYYKLFSVLFSINMPYFSICVTIQFHNKFCLIKAGLKLGFG